MRMSNSHTQTAIRGSDAKFGALHCSFWRNQMFNLADVNDRIGVVC